MPLDYARKSLGHVYDFEVEEFRGSGLPRQLPPVHAVKGQGDWKLTRGAFN